MKNTVVITKCDVCGLRVKRMMDADTDICDSCTQEALHEVQADIE